jgi:hypothetical protein
MCVNFIPSILWLGLMQRVKPWVGRHTQNKGPFIESRLAFWECPSPDGFTLGKAWGGQRLSYTPKRRKITRHRRGRVLHPCWVVLKIRDRYPLIINMDIYIQFKDLPKFDFFPFQNFNNPCIHSLSLISFTLIFFFFLYFDNIIQLNIYSSHPP